MKVRNKRAVKMVLAVKPDSLSFVSRVHMVEGRRKPFSVELFSNFHPHTMTLNLLPSANEKKMVGGAKKKFKQKDLNVLLAGQFDSRYQEPRLQFPFRNMSRHVIQIFQSTLVNKTLLIILKTKTYLVNYIFYQRKYLYHLKICGFLTQRNMKICKSKLFDTVPFVIKQQKAEQLSSVFL